LIEIMLSAGEASGDNYGAMLLRELQKRGDVRAFGLGGEQMRAAGCELTVSAHEVAAVGITEIVWHIPRIYAAYRRLVRGLRERRPAALVLIDFPDINFKIARHAHALGIPVIFFVSPQLWAWKPWRLKLVQQFVSKMLVIFPFEEDFYRERGVAVEFVGHPLADLPTPEISREDFARAYGLDPEKRWTALLPGSRRGEVRLNLPEMMRAAELLGADYEFILPVASTLQQSFLEENVGPSRGRLRFTFVPAEQARAAMLHARASIVASGTATVEAALIGNPFVVVYRVSGLTYLIGKRLVKVSHYAMVNLIAGREIVPELIQERFTAESVVEHLRPLLTDGHERQRMMDDLAQVRHKLKKVDAPEANAIARAADAIMASVKPIA
jgi:lipid-A-disaccharide synthase